MKPFRLDCDHVLTERRAALFPALALAAGVRPGETYGELGISFKVALRPTSPAGVKS